MPHGMQCRTGVQLKVPAHIDCRRQGRDWGTSYFTAGQTGSQARGHHGSRYGCAMASAPARRRAEALHPARGGTLMFHKSERYYDAIYAWKDYKAEAARLAEIISAHKASPGNALL